MVGHPSDLPWALRLDLGHDRLRQATLLATRVAHKRRGCERFLEQGVVATNGLRPASTTDIQTDRQADIQTNIQIDRSTHADARTLSHTPTYTQPENTTIPTCAQHALIAIPRTHACTHTRTHTHTHAHTHMHTRPRMHTRVYNAPKHLTATFATSDPPPGSVTAKQHFF